MWRRLFLATALFAVFLCLGTIGYVLIEGWDPLDAFYMTIITLSTVGFGEIRNLSPMGRIFTSFLILGGIGTACYLFSAITETVVSGQLSKVIGERRNRKALEGLKDHYVVCGYGKVGRKICDLLAAEGKPYAVVERSDRHLEHFRERNIPYVIGNAIEKENLEAAGIKRARGLFAALGDSSKNIYLALIAKSLNPGIRVVARNEDEEARLIFEASRVDAMVQPSKVGALRMFLAMVRPQVADLIEEVVVDRADLPEEILVEDLQVKEETTLRDLGIKTIRGVYAVLVKRADGRKDYVLDEETRLAPGDSLLVIGHERDLEAKLSEKRAFLA
ncbi:MAG: hypothetical protein GXO17_04785 [Thermodesulfobacteria bacterium]|nr:hypothetical protein [Thermodesulfobacteriota bacterium]